MLHPVHYSVLMQGRKRPQNMDRVKNLSNEDSEFLIKQAISLFEDCVNSGVSFQGALGSILLTGMKWGAGE